MAIIDAVNTSTIASLRITQERPFGHCDHNNEDGNYFLYTLYDLLK